MLFNEVIGHTALKKNLIASVTNGRLSHALMLLGAEGAGNLALALAFAQFIQCENRQPDDACGACASCLKNVKMVHPDLHFVFPVNNAKNKTGTVVSDDFLAEWRECMMANPYTSPNQWYDFIGLENKQGIISSGESHEIIRKIGLKTYESVYKVMIVWMPEKMNDVAANKLLKLIEEPPANTVYLLAAESTTEILPTIISRLQIIKVPKIDTGDLTNFLKHKHNLTDDQARQTAQLANGNYLKALDVMETSDINKLNLDKFIEIMRLCYSRKLQGIFQWVDDMAALGREKQKMFLEFALRMVRENVMLTAKSPDLASLTTQEKQFAEKFHPYINGRNVIGITQELNQAVMDIERNGYGKIILLDMCLKLVKLIKK